MRKLSVVFVIILLLAMGLSFLPLQSKALGPWPKPSDFNSNFDNFFNGNVNAFPWSLQPGATGSVSSSAFRSAPNSYSLVSNHAFISATFNATASIVNATVYAESPGTTTWQVLLSLKGATGTFNASITGGPSTTWTKGSELVPQIPSLTFTATIQAICSSGPCDPVFVDDFSVVSGAPVITGYNLELYNSSSAGPYWFDPSSVPGSQLVVTYPAASNNSNQWPNAPASGLSMADVKIPSLNTATLVTLSIGNIYTRTLIPNPSAGLTQNMQIYVDNPSSVQAYTAAVQAPPGFFGESSSIFIITGGHNVTSGYLDSTSKFSTYLVPGTYTVVLNDGTHELTQIVTFPVSTSSVTIDAYGAISNKQPASRVSSIAWTAGWNSTLTGIVVNYWDNTSTTSGLEVTISLTNATGTFEVFAQTYFVGTPFFSVVISGINKTLSPSLLVSLEINSSYFGNDFSVGSQPLATCVGCVFPATPNLPNSIGGLNVVFPNLQWINIGAACVLLFTAGGFGLFQSRVGFIILMGEAALFYYAGWLPVTPLFLSVFFALAILGLLAWYRKN